MTVPFVDLQAMYLPQRDAILAAIQGVCDSQHFILGPEVAGLEREVAALLGVAHAVGVSSGTDALLASFMALGLGPGDEVITSPFTFFATGGAIARTGATPVFAEIHIDTFNIDVADVEARITPRTKAIVPVHLYGQMADMRSLLAVTKPRGIAVVEDAAQALGAARDGLTPGAGGDFGCFSFFPTKNVGAYGDAGIVVTNSEALDTRLRPLRTHGSRDRIGYPSVGGNFRLDAIQAAILRTKLPALGDWNGTRQANAERYNGLLRAAGLVDEGHVILPATAPGALHIFHQYVLRARDRDALRAHLAERGISTGVYYLRPLHVLECFTELGQPAGSLPNAEEASATSVALPIFPGLTEAQQGEVVDAMAAFYA
jgi:dTDP-4-amino-4,6-dideoxygalactose transaminase